VSCTRKLSQAQALSGLGSAQVARSDSVGARRAGWSRRGETNVLFATRAEIIPSRQTHSSRGPIICMRSGPCHRNRDRGPGFA